MTTDSRNRAGTLTLDALPFQSQSSAVKLTPSVESTGDTLEMLDTTLLSPVETTKWSLDISAVQDFTDPEGLTEFCRSNAGDVVNFTWAPNGVSAVSYSGTCKIRAMGIGGDVNSRLVESVSFPIETGPTPNYPG